MDGTGFCWRTHAHWNPLALIYLDFFSFLRVGALTFSWASVRVSIVTTHYALEDYGMM